MRWLGKVLLWWTPGFVAAKVCREVSSDFTALLAEYLDKSNSGLAAFREAARETGKRSGERLKHELRLAGGFEDAELAWRLVSKMSGMRFSVARGAGGSVFEHLCCPVLDAGGKRLCDNFCVPLVEGLTEALAPGCSVKIIRAGEGSRPCAKALVRG
jgi:hypothetical protein